MKIGMIGCGFIGEAMKIWIEKHNPSVELVISDPPKGYNGDAYAKDLDACFVQIHVDTLPNGRQDIGTLQQIIQRIPPDVPTWIRTTILPSTLAKLQYGHFGEKRIPGTLYSWSPENRLVFYLPEFLTQRTYIEDFEKQTMIFTGIEKDQKYIDLLEKIFVGKKHICMTSYEASLAKYAHNVFGAMKVTFFNAISKLCDRDEYEYVEMPGGAPSFENVRAGVLASGYINEEHTRVPGPDSHYRFGGKCFTKDLRALEKEYRYTPLGRLIEPIEALNREFREH